MMRKAIFLVACTLALMIVSNASMASDYIDKIQNCTSNTVIIHFQNAGWAYIWVPDLGKTRVEALNIMAAQALEKNHPIRKYKKTGASGFICGVNAFEIETLAVQDPLKS